MRVTLVQPPSNRYDTSELAPPLGLLSIAAVLRDDDIDVSLIDLNLETMSDPSRLGEDFYDWASQLVAASAPDLVGFTSMALESHVCLEIARRLKQMGCAAPVVLGGPHFSAVAWEMLTHYPWVDYVVVGEGEYAMRELARRLRKGRSIAGIANLASLDRGALRLERRLKPSKSLDEIPFPAYELVDLERYFALNPYRVLDIESARGCALRCAFCYSSVHWGQGEQARTIDRILADVERHHALGAKHLFFVGDNFLNSKSFATSVADAIGGAGLDLTWRCYATLPQLSEEVVRSLTRSGCNCVFIGVDAVSERSKRDYRKTYFRGWPELKQTLERCNAHGMEATCAFMVTPPTSAQAIDDTEAALQMATRVYNLQCGVRLNPLTVYPQTGIAPVEAAFPRRYSNEKPRLLLDGHWVTENNPFAGERPDLFPYHCTVGRPDEYAHFIRATHVGFTLLDHFPRTLMQAAHAGRSLWTLLRETAALVDYSDQHKPTWKIQEAEAFARVVSAGRVDGNMADTLTFELAENRLRRGAPPVQVRIEVDEVPLAVQLRPHAEIRLARSPAEYETTERLPETDPPPQTYVLVPSGPAVQYLRPSEAIGERIHALQQAAIDGMTVRVPGHEVIDLVSANLIGLPEHRSTGLERGAAA